MKKISTRSLVILAALTAMEIILSRFVSINTWNTKIGLSFVPVAVAAILFGPVAGGAVGALGDFLGAMLFPIGAYFPGFTFTAFLTGAVFGVFLRKDGKALRAVAAVAVHQILLSLGLNTLWLSILNVSPFIPLAVTRLPQCAIMAAVELAVLLVLPEIIKRVQKQVTK